MAVTRNHVSRTMLIVALQCLALIVPALALGASPTPGASTVVRAQADASLVAFLRDGNLWLMNGDGTDQRAVTDYAEPVQDYSWSPSGRYLLIQRGGRHVVGTEVVQSDEVTDLYDVTTGEISEIARSSQLSWMIASANPPIWALDADELIWVTFSDSTYTLTQIELDGTTTWLASFEQPYICGGPDGPSATMWGLAWEQGGGPWHRNTYEPLIWSDAGRIAWVQPFCGNARTVDLATGGAQEVEYRPLTAAGANMLAGGDESSSWNPQLLDLMTGGRTPLYEGEDYFFGPGGAIFFTRVVDGQDSSFASRWDDIPEMYTDNSVELWRTDIQASVPVRIASIPAFRAGLPRPTADGSAVVFGIVDNPSELIGIDESSVDRFTPELYAEHLKAVRVDIASGDVTVLTDDAILPKPQRGSTPTTSVPDSGSSTVEPISTPEPTPTLVTAQPISDSSDGWIAYSGADGNIWLARPDGGDQRQVTTDGTAHRPYLHPNWSPDGTMLVFSTSELESEGGNGIFLLSDGVVTRVPGIDGCHNAAFMANGQQLALLCAAVRGEGAPPSQQTLDSTPADGFVSVVDLDGSNWRVLAPFQLQIDGQDTLWWTMLRTYDLSISPIDGEILVNSIFWSSGRFRQIHLIDSRGSWDARFGMPNSEAGRIWGSFAADATHVLARLCRGCYKDSSGPADTSIVLLDREGNLVDTLYTPDANVVIGSFSQSPDGEQLLISSTTEETDLDFGTAGLPYTTHLVELVSGTVTDLPIEGTGFVWQPVESEIGIPDDSPEEPQPATTFVEIAPIMAITCTTSSEGFWISGGGGMNMPEGCDWSNGASFTISGPNGESFGACTIEGFACNGSIQMPIAVEVTVTLDETTIPQGYAVVDGNPKRFTLPASKVGSDSEQWLFVSMPAGAADQSPIGDDLAIDPGSNWIAYTGSDGDLWLMQPDGSGQTQLTYDGSPDSAYGAASWSHDGTMLVFTRAATTAGGISQVYLLKDGVAAPIPGVYGCDSAAFLPGDQQIAMTCGRGGDVNASEQTLQSDPSMGLVSIASLDGSNWHVRVAYNQTDTNIWPTLGTGPGASTAGGVSIVSDGTIYFQYSTQMSSGMAFVPPDSSIVERMESPLESGAVGGMYVDAAGEFLISGCGGCYIHSHEDPQFSIGWMDRDGTITATLLTPDPTLRLGNPTISSDGGTLIYSIADGGYPYYGAIQSRDLASGDETTIAQGWGPVWQPNPGVAMQLPTSTEQVPPTTATPEQIQPIADATMPPIDAPAATQLFIGIWDGTGIQENPHGEWPVGINITGGGLGEIVGTSVYLEQSCGGNLILQELSDTEMVLLEQLTYGQGACADNGTIVLSDYDGVTILFTWNGIGPNGTPSSASGRLGRPDNAEPVEGSTSPGNAPQASGAALPESFVDTTWTGTGLQENPENTWPVTVSFTGGNVGEVIGTIDYPTLGCGGEIILTEVNTEDDFGSFWAQEHITYGQDNCIDGGQFLFFLSEGAFLLNFNWTSPSGPTTATGQLDPV